MNRINRREIGKFFTVSGLLLAFWLLSSLIISSYESFTVLVYPENSVRLRNMPVDRMLTKGNHVTGEFVAHHNNLGIVTIKLESVSSVGEEDTLVFRIREKQSDTWLSTQSYSEGIMRNNYIFPFGFPIIPDSKGKTYVFDLSSVSGTIYNAIKISDAMPVVTSRYKFDVSELKHPRTLAVFLIEKIRTLLTNRDILKSTAIYLFPFAVYFVIGMVRYAGMLSRGGTGMHAGISFRAWPVITILAIGMYVLQDILLAQIHYPASYAAASVLWIISMNRIRRGAAITALCILALLGLNLYVMAAGIPYSVRQSNGWIYLFITYFVVRTVGDSVLQVAGRKLRKITLSIVSSLRRSRVRLPHVKPLNPVSLFMIAIPLLYVGAVYLPWFVFKPLTAPDFPTYYPQRFEDFGFRRNTWTNIGASGTGESAVPEMSLNAYVQTGANIFVNVLNIPWLFASRYIVFWPFLLMGFVGSLYFAKTFVRNRNLSFLSSIIYLTNTYILMLTGGGQAGLFLSYSVVPFVIASYARQQRLIFIASYALMLLFDVRFSVLTTLAIVIYTLSVVPNRDLRTRVRFLIGSAAVVAGLHAFWFLPGLFSRGLAIPKDFSDPGWLSFLSFAEFSKTVSMLHPNWPDNMFGKTYFTRPEFLILPIIAFSVFLFRGKQKDGSTNMLRFFGAMAVVGAFLAKGTQPPFGGAYSWLFTHVPLFAGFRDPTKFYLFVALSYAVLIPTAVHYISEAIARHLNIRVFRLAVPVGITVLFLLFWTGTLLPQFRGSTTGTFGTYAQHIEYTRFANLISQDHQFSRTLAVPKRNRFIFESELHPVVSASDLLHTTDIAEIGRLLTTASVSALLKQYSVRYVVIPEDNQNEIFLTDRKFDPVKRASLIESLAPNDQLVDVDGFDDLQVYSFSGYVGLVYGGTFQNPVAHAYRMVSPERYTVSVPERAPRNLTFGQKYDPGWRVWDGQNDTQSYETGTGQNGFRIGREGPVLAEVYYAPRSYTEAGTRITIFVLIACLSYVMLFFVFRLRPGPRSYALYILAVLIAFTYAQSRLYPKNQLDNRNIWWSREWSTVRHPRTGIAERVTEYGGSELRFAVTGKAQARVVFSDFGPVDQNGVQIWVNGNEIGVPDADGISEQEVRISSDAAPYEVRIRAYCSGTEYCRLRIRSITLSGNGSIRQSGMMHKANVAVLGDSITSLYGKENYTYVMADRNTWLLHNASSIGSTVARNFGTKSGLDRVGNDIIPFRPDVVIVALGTNDAVKNVPPDTFAESYDKLLTELLTSLHGSRLYTVGLFTDHLLRYPSAARYDQLIQETSIRHGATFIPMADVLERTDYIDELHPSLDAQRKMADHVLQMLDD